MTESTDPLSLPRLEEDLRTILTDWPAHTALVGRAWADFRLLQQIQTEHKVDIPGAARLLVAFLLDKLAQNDAELAQVIRERCIEEISVSRVSHRHAWSTATTYRKQRQGTTALAELLQQAEVQLRELTQRTALARLPDLPHQTLFGVEPALDRLHALLREEESRLILVSGIGGIGKTALAHTLLRRESQRPGFADFAWVSAQQREFDIADPLAPVTRPALSTEELVETLAGQLLPSQQPRSASQALQILEERLTQFPHLIVVDNLETVADVESLLPMLERLAGRSKFVLTSRESMRSNWSLHHFQVPELRQDDALGLIRHEARRHDLPHVALADDPTLIPIFETVGGNPLALRLVAGQLHLLTIDQVVADLHEARGRSAGALYSYIYRQAWVRLSAADQDTLMLMPLFAQGGADLSAIKRLSDLEHGALVESLGNLARLSLINVSSSSNSRRFSIHRLTESFLRKEVIRWQEEDYAS